MKKKRFSLILPGWVWVVLIGVLIGMRILGDRQGMTDLMNWSFYGFLALGVYVLALIIVEIFSDVIFDAD